MASQVTADEVAHIAELARLDLSSAEREMFAQQLTDILAYAATVQQADTASVVREGTPTPRNPGGGWSADGPEPGRSDTPVPGIDRDVAIAQAPDGARDAGLFRVPKVL